MFRKTAPSAVCGQSRGVTRARRSFATTACQVARSCRHPAGAVGALTATTPPDYVTSAIAAHLSP
jgi:hypothetical protein